MKKIVTIITAFILAFTMTVPVMANAVVVNTSYTELFAFDGEYSVYVRHQSADPEHLLLLVYDSNGITIVEDNTIPSSDLYMERGLAVVTIPEYNISLTWTYVANETQIGRTFIKKFPEPDSRLRQYVNYSDSLLNELSVSGILFGNPFTSIVGYLVIIEEQIISK